MRLWHKDLIPYLPQPQLISQWRECCAIASRLAKDGTPNHLLVNKVLEYPTDHFVFYTNLVVQELKNRGYKVSVKTWHIFCDNLSKFYDGESCVLDINIGDIFKYWHNDIYLGICFSNLYEKYLCGGIKKEEFDKIRDYYAKRIVGR